MLNEREIKSVLIFIIILNCIVLISVITLSSLTYAQEDQELHKKTLDEIKHTSPNQTAHITVGKGPIAIGVDNDRNKIYVANNGNDSVSVIDGKTNTNIRNIPVGKGPSFYCRLHPDVKNVYLESIEHNINCKDPAIHKSELLKLSKLTHN